MFCSDTFLSGSVSPVLFALSFQTEKISLFYDQLYKSHSKNQTAKLPKISINLPEIMLSQIEKPKMIKVRFYCKLFLYPQSFSLCDGRKGHSIAEYLARNTPQKTVTRNEGIIMVAYRGKATVNFLVEVDVTIIKNIIICKEK